MIVYEVKEENSKQTASVWDYFPSFPLLTEIVWTEGKMLPFKIDIKSR